MKKIIFIVKNIIYIIIILLILLMESDRNFSEKKSLKFYYIGAFPLPFLGAYNSLIRLFHPKQTHIYNSTKFPTDKILKKNFHAIKDECTNIYKLKNSLMNFADINKIILYSDEHADKWKVFPIKFYGEINKTAYKLCPNICKIIEECKDVHIALISILEPGRYIRPHKGPCNTMLRYQLAVQIPSDRKNCWIKINNHKYNWKEGESIVFDDTYLHEVYNNTNEPRIILFLDIERPVKNIFKSINKKLLKISKLTKFIKDTNNNIENNNAVILKKK